MNAVASRSGNQCEYCQLSAIGEQKSKAKGFRGSVMGFSNDEADAFMGCVRWDNKENYVANSNRPEQDGWYQEMRANLAGDMDWFDATVGRETKP